MTTHYQQTDTFSTVTDVPLAGTGTSTPEAAAAGSDYSAWPWEAVLATVLGTPIPDRTEVTGQPWLTVVNQGQAAPASHLIWTASWDDQAASGATSLQVYLSPQLYTTGGAWDEFENAPAAAMSAIAGVNYSGLTVDPRTFQSARVALAGVTTELGTLAQQFGQLNHEATADASGFQGSLAGVVADLFSSLRTIALSLHDQLTTPASYSDTMGTTGDSAGAFLASLNSAYTGWMQVPEYSPLGAVVQALMQVAVPNGTGGFVIPNPQQTTYGDLTTDGPWTAVEQQAKALWNGALTGNSGGFAGLDPLGQRALGALVTQYNTAISALVPVIGPVPPPITPKTLSHDPTSGPPKPPGLPGGPGTGGAYAIHGPDAQAQPAPGGGPGPGPSGTFPPGSKDVVLTTSGTGGPGPANGPPGTGNGPVAAAAVTFPVSLAAGTGTPGPGGSAQAGSARPGALPGPQPGQTEAAVVPGGLAGAGPLLPSGQAADDELAQPRGLAGAIGAGTQTPRAVAAIPENLAFGGTIGLPGAAADDDRKESRQARARDRAAAQARLAPAAGFAIGRDLSRGAVEQAAVPVIASKPQAVLSSAINAGPGTSAAIGGLQVPGVGPGHAGLQAGGELGSAGTMTGPGTPASLGSPATSGGPAGPSSTPGGAGPLGGAEGTAMTGGEGLGGGSQTMVVDGTGPMGMGGMGPMGMGGMGPMGMGGMGGGGRGRGQERERKAYLPEDDSYWGTSPDSAAAALGADPDDPHDPQDHEFMRSSGHLAGIGADDERAPDRKPRPDRRTR